MAVPRHEVEFVHLRHLLFFDAATHGHQWDPVALETGIIGQEPLSQAVVSTERAISDFANRPALETVVNSLGPANGARGQTIGL